MLINANPLQSASAMLLIQYHLLDYFVNKGQL